VRIVFGVHIRGRYYQAVAATADEARFFLLQQARASHPVQSAPSLDEVGEPTQVRAK